MGSLGPVLHNTAIAALVITTIAVLLRFYTRIFIQHKFAADDWLVLVCQLFFIGFMICVLEEVSHGLGEHLVEIVMADPNDLMVAMKFWFVAETLFLLLTCTVKFAIILFLFSLNPPQPLRIAIIIIAIISLMTGLGSLFQGLFQCLLVSYFWTMFTPGEVQGHCVNPHGLFILVQMFNALDVVTDFGLATLPCIMVWNMTMPKAKKFGVSILLGVAALPAISALARGFYFRDLLFNATDFTYSAWPVTITSTTEPAIGITVVCLAQIRPLLHKILPDRWFSSPVVDQVDRPPTFGAADQRPQRRTVGRSLLTRKHVRQI